MTVYNVTFSPTGGTRKVADILAGELGGNIVDVELCVPEKKLNIPELTEDDICIISVPSFGGRVPQIAADRIGKFKANGAKAVLVCVYGNRAYEDTLTELKDTAEKAGFKCFAAVAALAEHSITRDIAKGRPDSRDEAVLKEFAGKIKEKMQADDFNLCTQIPGNATYKERGKVKSVPEAGDACVKCGACAKICPAEAIDFENPNVTDGEKCVTCMKCIKVCPKNARAINSERYAAILEMLGKVAADRKESQLYI